MEVFIQTILVSLSNAGVYAMLALGVSLVFGVMGVMNFAHGEFTTIGAYAAVLIGTTAYAGIVGPLQFWLSMALAVLGAGVIGWVAYRLVIRPLLRAPSMMVLLSTFGLALVLQGVLLATFTGEARSIPRNTDSFTVLGITVAVSSVINVVAALVVVGLVGLVLAKTPFGSEMRAVSQNRREAALAGIDTSRVESRAFVLSVVVAGIAGVIIAQRALVSPFTGFELVLKAFAIAIVAGLGRIAGILPTALFLGLLEGFVSTYADPTLAGVVIYVGLLTTLLLRPQGLVSYRTRT